MLEQTENIAGKLGSSVLLINTDAQVITAYPCKIIGLEATTARFSLPFHMNKNKRAIATCQINRRLRLFNVFSVKFSLPMLVLVSSSVIDVLSDSIAAET